MKKPRFVPYLHHCKEGNHYHLVTGPDFGASPPFASIFTALFLLDQAVNPKDSQDLIDRDRIRKELLWLRVKDGKRNRPIWALKRRWEPWTTRYWCQLLDGSLRASEMVAFLFFTNTPCDFVEKKQQGNVLTLRGRKVSEVKKE
jgi:hypothetical protein